MIFFPVVESVIVSVGEVVSLVDVVVAVVINTIEQFGPAGIHQWVGIVAVVEVVEQIQVVIRIVD